MKFSKITLIYPHNRVLEHTIANTIGMLSDDLVKAAIPDSHVTVADNFLYTRGNFDQSRFSSNIYESLRDALEGLLKNKHTDRDPVAWSETMSNLGNILAAQGQQKSDADMFQKAIQCFNQALEALDQEKSPHEWAVTQYNLGTASQALGRLLDAAKPLKNAIDAYTNALLVWSRDKSPEDWMYTMHQLGAALHTYGRLLKGNRHFQKSVVAYKNALAVLNADEYAFELTATHNNRGAVLHHLGESEENSERLKEAINSYEKALAVSMEQQLPIHLAVICRVNKATAQVVLAELTNDSVLADEVADEFDLILECFPHALQPLCAKHCEEQLNKARSLSLPMSASR